ncbi:MAG: hypothetical protein ACI8Z9_002353, partial [Paraglaciecola sp.]
TWANSDTEGQRLRQKIKNIELIHGPQVEERLTGTREDTGDGGIAYSNGKYGIGALVTALGTFAQNTKDRVTHEFGIIPSNIGPFHDVGLIADAYNSIVYGNEI